MDRTTWDQTHSVRDYSPSGSAASTVESMINGCSNGGSFVYDAAHASCRREVGGEVLAP